ncbi:uncharacterized protein N7483_000295 [Penicillium malachiteum]|uniref:uncharacterized protein n=1 Tax=Penicillium malachiteum TaxID=1324776 RepID=UPI002546919F|nr:uncharacterized protein N7483_000295 [Penicillium malachiteum]KAJ5735170.1 hypothetical protein N7483_000295 [Penicillium malachiteum]
MLGSNPVSGLLLASLVLYAPLAASRGAYDDAASVQNTNIGDGAATEINGSGRYCHWFCYSTEDGGVGGSKSSGGSKSQASGSDDWDQKAPGGSGSRDGTTGGYGNPAMYDGSKPKGGYGSGGDSWDRKNPGGGGSGGAQYAFGGDNVSTGSEGKYCGCGAPIPG